MEDFLIYIGKVSIAAGIFYLAYLVLFQKQKHFGFNRIYLPASMLISFVIPLITFTTVKFVEMPVSEGSVATFAYLPSSSVEYVAPAFEFEWYHYLFGLYMLGAAGFLLHLLFGHLKALHIIRTSKIRKLFNQLLNITNKDVHPFSFFNKIVLSEKTLSSPDLEMIVDHEKVHVREKHTFDILFTEIMFLLQWFNPFAWLIKGAVRNNLEYKTDDEIAKIYNPQKYQLAMVALADKKEVAPFLTALNGSQLKNRIIMMKKKTENKFTVVKQLVVLPLLAVLVMGLSNKEIKTEFVQTKAKVEVIVDGKVIPADDENLSKVDFSKGINSMDVINALNINNVVANGLNLDREVPTLYIRTSDYVPGTDFDFEENTSTSIGVENTIKENANRAEELYYAIDNKIVSEEEYIEKGKAGFENIIILSGKNAISKYGEKYKNVADATTGVPNFVIQDAKEDWVDKNSNLENNYKQTRDPRTERFLEVVGSTVKDGLTILDPSLEDFPYTMVDNKEITDKVVYNSLDLKFGEVIPPAEAVKVFGEKGKNGALFYSTKATSYEDFRNNYSSEQGQIQADLQYQNLQKYTIAGIEISGSRNFDKSLLINWSGLKIGQEIEMPGNEIKSAISKFWDMGSFSDVKISASNIVDDNIWLDIYLEERQSHLNNNVQGGNSSEAKNIQQNKIIEGKTVTGKVTDVKGKPVPGVSVIVKGTTTGTITDNSGNFEINVDNENATLIFSGRIFVDQEVEIKNKTQIDVVLKYSIAGEVLYGDQKNIPEKTYKFIAKGRVTDTNGNPLSGATVLVKDKKTGTVTNSEGEYAIGIEEDGSTLSFYMNGFKSKEVNVEGKEEIRVKLEKDSDESNGNSGMSFSIGQLGFTIPVGDSMITSISKEELGSSNDGSDKLYIVDGKITKDPGAITIEDVTNMTVLKNPTATKLYGEKGKNGVVIVTTKNATSDINGNIKIDELIETRKKEGAINSILELRQFITREIVFPTEARDEDNDELNMRFYVRVNNKGEITDIGENIGGDGEILPVEEIVVVALRPKNVVKEKDIKNGNLMAKEAERVLHKLPDIDIPEAKGKILEFLFRFVLEDGESLNADYISVPEGFSPNGDGVHDVFEVAGLAKKYPNFNMKILNKTGDLLWEYQHNGNPNSAPKWWNGKAGSEKAETGIYFYVIELNDGSAKSQTGYFSLAE